MSDVTLRPRTILEILDASFSLLRRDYLKYLTIMAVVSLPYQIMMMFWQKANFSIALSGGDTATASSSLGLDAFLVPLLGMLLWYPLIDAAIIAAASESYHGREINVAAVLGRLGGRLGSLLLTMLLRTIALVIGSVLFIIPGFYLYLRFFCVPAVVMLERTSISGAFTRSGILTKGLKGKTLGMLVLVYIIYSCLSWVSLLALIFTRDPMVLAVSQVIITVLLYPMLPVAMGLLYYDMRIRKEGYDIELLSNEIGDQLAPEPAR